MEKKKQDKSLDIHEGTLSLMTEIRDYVMVSRENKPKTAEEAQEQLAISGQISQLVRFLTNLMAWLFLYRAYRSEEIGPAILQQESDNIKDMISLFRKGAKPDQKEPAAFWKTAEKLVDGTEELLKETDQISVH